jgi:hypothetical protein
MSARITEAFAIADDELDTELRISAASTPGVLIEITKDGERVALALDEAQARDLISGARRALRLSGANGGDA